jgi:hypothetical protein
MVRWPRGAADAAAALAALAALAADCVDGAGPQRGYAASFQSQSAIAGIRAGQIDWNATGWSGMDSEVTWSAWLRYSPHADFGVPFRLVTATKNYLFDMQWDGADLDWE